MSYQSNNNNRRRRRRRYRLKPVPIFIALVIVVTIIWCIISLISSVFKPEKDNSSVPPTSITPSSESGSALPAATDPVSPAAAGGSSSNNTPTLPANVSKADWNLVLLNRANPIDDDFSITKTKFDNQDIDSRVATSYQMMVDAAKNEGITLYLRSGYRSISTQKANYEAEISRHTIDGKTKEEATIATEKFYARPGQSEHHTGLALDIITPEYHKSPNTLDERFMETEAYKWLIKNCATYGFILRYPDNKVGTTKINFEPWHYRYVGVENAKYITENGLCLEEYIALLSK